MVGWVVVYIPLGLESFGAWILDGILFVLVGRRSEFIFLDTCVNVLQRSEQFYISLVKYLS